MEPASSERVGHLARRLERSSRFMEQVSRDLDEVELRTQYDLEFSPIGWHLGHVAWQEEWWIARRFGRRPALDERLDHVFDAFRPNKGERGQSIPSASRIAEYRAEVRAATLELLPELCAERDGLMCGAGLCRFIANHESQHTETVLAIRLAAGLFLASEASPNENTPITDRASYVTIPEARVVMGSDHDEDGWDNERGEHEVQVPSFQLRRTPVTNGEWLEFVAAGGYTEDAYWSAAGRAWKRQRGIRFPLYWREHGQGSFWERTLSGDQPLGSSQPVCHVSWYEAEAYARFAGARLPSEREWERVAGWGANEKRRYPWGNQPEPGIDWALERPIRAAVGSAPHGASESGVLDLSGGVWEWTEDVFAPYTGFTPQAYEGYSQPWFDGRHRVARGGSYVTQPELARSSFRNWYSPEMRLPFLGVRLARDAA